MPHLTPAIGQNMAHCPHQQSFSRPNMPKIYTYAPLSQWTELARNMQRHSWRDPGFDTKSEKVFSHSFDCDWVRLYTDSKLCSINRGGSMYNSNPAKPSVDKTTVEHSPDADIQEQASIFNAFVVTVQHLFGGFHRLFQGVTDPRHPAYITYPCQL